ncbi:MAG: metallophosphoesterase [Chitinophagales bacterium]
MQKNIHLFFLLIYSCFVYANVNIINYGDVWKYKDDGSNLAELWKSLAYNDTSWASGNGQLGYGDSDESTVINAGCTPVSTCTTKFITTYFRKNITIGSTATYLNYTLNVKRDDGVVIYIDSIEVFRNNMPTGTTLYNTPASVACTDDGNGIQTTTLTVAQLPTGTHTIAVEIHQSAANSSDISFDLELIANENNAAVIRGPYLNSATQNSVHVRWRTNVPANSVVNYGLINGNLISTITDNALVTEHDVTITGLTNDTKYYYSVGNTNPAIQTLKTGTNYFFYTLPLKGIERLSRFLVFGDCGNNSTNQINVRNRLMQYLQPNHADGFLLLGDNAYSSGTDAEYTSNFFSQYQDSILRNVVLWPSPGNHDYANTAARQNDHLIPYYDMFTLPTAAESGGLASGTEAYYSFDFANIHFLALDSYGKDSNTYRIWDTLGPQVRWIKNDLAANTQKWTIAYWHHPPYTLGSHTSEGEADLVAIRQNFIRILERLGVDLILCGHSHVYERSYLLNGHYGTETSFNFATHAFNDSSSAKYDGSVNSCPYIKNLPRKTGTVYTVVGSSGQLGGVQIGWPINAMSYSDNINGGAMVLKIEGNRLDAEWVCADSVVRDRFTIMKDVNQKTILNVITGNAANMSSSWIGSYNWSNIGVTKNQSYITSGVGKDTVVVTDNLNCLKDSFIVTKNLQLPVELISFSAQLNNQYQVNLTWSTASEKNNVSFEIEWSTDGIHFTKIGETPGNGMTTLKHDYQFMHENPVYGNNYYRLKQVDFDLTCSYSNIVNIVKYNEDQVRNKFIYVYPNPSKNGLYNVDFYSNQNLNSFIVLYDMLGNEVYKDVYNIQNGIAHYQLNIASFAKGNYLLKIEGETIHIQR